MVAPAAGDGGMAARCIAEFLSPRLCELARLYVTPRTPAELTDLRVSEEEFKQVRAELVHQKTTMGVPVIEIVDADRKGRGELWLEHRHDGIGLDEEYAKGTLSHLARLWRRPVVVRSIDRAANDVWYRCEPTGLEGRLQSRAIGGKYWAQRRRNQTLAPQRLV